jgi:drug/metabolite transporter (DMT)-like permease
MRLPIGTVILGLIAHRHLASVRANPHFRRTLLVLLAAGAFTSASSLFYLYAVALAGAARAATLSAIAPVFAAPLAVLFLRERLSARVGFGTILSVCGVWLVV